MRWVGIALIFAWLVSAGCTIPPFERRLEPVKPEPKGAPAQEDQVYKSMRSD